MMRSLGTGLILLKHHEAQDLIAAEVPGELALLSLAGSHAYGTNHPDSDVDYRGVYVAPLERVLAIRAPAETFDRQVPDVTLYELRHFASLAARGNPTVLEVLWAPTIEMNMVGGKLKVRRQVFLSKRVVKTYGGYAMQQLAKARNGTGGSRGVAHLRREKFFLHTLRLLEAGTEILESGEVPVGVRDPDGLWERARGTIDQVETEAAVLFKALDVAAAKSDLPDHPDMDAIDALVYEIRMGVDSVDYWTRGKRP